MELESKALGAPTEVKQAFDEFLRGFEAFKQSNDERLAGIERRSGDVLAEEKVDRINRAFDQQNQKIEQLMLAAARPALGGEKKSFDPALKERKTAFDRYVRKKSNNLCLLPVGAVRLLDAAASGADPAAVAAAIAPGQPDDAPSGIALSEAVTLLATDLAIARDNADQLRRLEGAVAVH